MKFPRYWSKGSFQADPGYKAPFKAQVWQWSDDSLEDAHRKAEEAARRLAQRLEVGQTLPRGYGYSDRPLREPVLREFTCSDGQPAAILSRNAFGCTILNTARMMFIDVDDSPNSPDDGPEAKSLLSRLFGSRRKEPSGQPYTARLNSFAEALGSRGHWNLRVYRTRAGFRLVAAHGWFDPLSNEVAAIFREFGGDPLYGKLCTVQECFRARLTPKPWRVGCGAPPVRWPFQEAGHEQGFKRWEADYLAAARNHATCRLLQTLGAGSIHPEIQPLIKLHDDLTRAQTDLPLA